MISILYVDDEPDLLDIAKIFLEQSPDLHVDTFTSAKDALESPQFSSYDAIISDYQMPGMDGIAFLKSVRETYGKTPFILFTGRGREEIVIEAINNGADFYLQKGGEPKSQFVELAHKVRQAVGRRQVERSFIESQKRLADIIDFLPDATFAIDREGRVIAWNRAIEEMTGIPAEEMIGKGDFAYAIPFYGTRRPILIDHVFKTDEEIAQYYSIISRQGSAITAETSLPHPKGVQLTVLAKASPLFNQQGEPVGAIESIRDITERRKADDELRAAYEQISASEEELREQLDLLIDSEKRSHQNERRLVLAMEAANEGLWDWNLKTSRVYFSPQYYRMLGYEPGEFPASFENWRSLVHPDDIERAEATIRSSIEHRQLFEVEFRLLTKGGGWKWILGRGSVMETDEAGNPARMVGTHVDISRVKKAEEAAREKSIELDRFFTTSLDLFCIADTNGYFRRLNPEWERALGYTPADLEGHRFLDFVHPDDLPATLDAISRLKGQAEILNFTNRYRHRDGTYRWIEWRSKPVGELIYAAARDVTEKKKTEYELRAAYEQISASEEELREQLDVLVESEKKIRESEARYRNVIRFSPLGMHFYEIDPAGALIFMGANPAADAILGVDNSRFIGKSIGDAFPGLLETDVPDQYVRVARDGGTWHTNQIIYDKGEIRGAFAVDAFQIRPGAMAAFFQDITRRISAEEVLRESEERYRSIFEHIQDVYYRCDREGNLVMASPSILPLLGYNSLDELIGKNIAEDLWQHPQDREKFLERLAKNGSVTHYDKVLRRRDGSPVTVSTSSHYYLDHNGNRAGVEGIFHDVTSVREAAQQRELLASLLDVSPASITVHDYTGKFLYANQRTFDLHGYTKDEFMALSLQKLDVPESGEHISERIEELQRNGEASFDVEHFRKDGTRIPLHIVIRKIHWESKEAILSVATAIDNESLTGSLTCNGNTLCNCIVDNSHDIIYMIRPDGTITFISPSWTATLGHSPAEVVGRSFREFVVPEDVPGCAEFLQRSLESGAVQPGHEYRVYHKDGSVHWYQTTLKPVHDGDGAIMTLVGNAVDITGRLATEQALRESEALYRSVIENIQDAFIRVGAKGLITMVSPSAARMFGYGTGSAMLGLPMRGLYEDESGRDAVRARIERAGSVTDLAVRFRRKDGSAFWGSLNARLTRDTDGAVTGTDKVIHDITERHVMEEAIREVNKKLNLLNTITRHDVANQLTALQGFVQIASMMKTDPVIHEYLAKIHGVADTITRQLEFTRAYQELGIRKPLWFSVEEIVSMTTSRIPVKFSKTCGGIEVFADPMLERVFFNLFDNAARHGTGVSTITVRCEREPDGILIIVEDDGAGIPLAEKEKIFSRGYGKHTGLGLFLVKEILAITGIGIRETGVPGTGARFEMLVPKTSCRSAR